MLNREADDRLPLDDLSDTQSQHVTSGLSNDFSTDTNVPNPFGPSKRTRSSLTDISSSNPIDLTDDEAPNKHLQLKSLKQFLKTYPKSKVGKLFLKALESDNYDPNDPINKKIARQWAESRKKTLRFDRK
jgi:hypothetical protein